MPTNPKLVSFAKTYGLALAATGVAVLLRWAIEPLVGHNLPFITFLAAVALVAVLRGGGATSATIVLSAVAARYFFMPPQMSFLPLTKTHAIALTLFVLSGGFIAWITDLLRKERKLAEAAMAERLRVKEQVQMVVELAPNALIMADPDGRITLVNAQAEKWFGYSRKELLGQPVEILVPERFRPVHPGHRHGFAAKPEARPMGAGRDLFGRRKDGTEFPVEIGLNPIPTKQGMMVLASIVDITERKHTENALAARATELRRSNKDLEQFAYMASHDLQEPLRMITSFLNLLERRVGDQLDKEAKEYVTLAVDGSRRMQALINDLLAYSRAGSKGIQLAAINAREPLERALAVLRQTIDESKASVTSDDLPTVMADASQLTQVFQNLIGNALKYHRDNVPPQVTIGSKRQDSQWLLWVKDNGVGMAPEDTSRIFEVFQRVHERSKFPGTGIGLAICRKMIERHGGRIWVESQPDQGATFFFTLPAA